MSYAVLSNTALLHQKVANRFQDLLQLETDTTYLKTFPKSVFTLHFYEAKSCKD